MKIGYLINNFRKKIEFFFIKCFLSYRVSEKSKQKFFDSDGLYSSLLIIRYLIKCKSVEDVPFSKSLQIRVTVHYLVPTSKENRYYIERN